MGKLRLRLSCRGAVQGVGFRPTILRLAHARQLTGWIANDASGATFEVEGERAAVRDLVDRLPQLLPPLARLDGLTSEEIPLVNDATFVVEQSKDGQRAGALVPPDARLCADCRRDLDDPEDRRFHYPFTTCTNCGPRYSLVHSLPYDRPRTAMACFPLCPACQCEYENPLDRRFHAEPVCCPACGPRLWLVDRTGAELAEADLALTTVQGLLVEGAIVALKALGGFQLACRADDQPTVQRLRQRKRRPTKPFAVMVRNLALARELAVLTAEDEALLRSSRAPVLLAPGKGSASLAPAVAPGLDDVGLLLPTTPLHVELLRDHRLGPLVMTSGNAAEEPICCGNREAVERLSFIADYLLLHDRDVVRRVDDSVSRTTSQGPIVIRRARGWVPEPLQLPTPAPEPVLAVGAHLQATGCVATGDLAFLTQHVGDLDTEPARLFHREVITHLEGFLQVQATQLVADLHPDYPSTWLAQELAETRGARLFQVQHHLAHAAAVLAEHHRFPAPGETSLALCLDGTGWGGDGSAWGGELLQLDGELTWRRLGHLEPLPLVGGEMAVREPWRVAVAALSMHDATELLPRLPIHVHVEADSLATVSRLARSNAWPLATGAGRLFEAAGALAGLSVVNHWEGEAAARFEALASSCTDAEPWPEVASSLGPASPTIPSSALLVAMAHRLTAGDSPAEVAAGFHTTFCHCCTALLQHCVPQPRGPVALGGGCMVNRLLIKGLVNSLGAIGFEPLLATRVPPGDGGIAFGQAVLAAAALDRQVTLSPYPSSPGSCP